MWRIGVQAAKGTVTKVEGKWGHFSATCITQIFLGKGTWQINSDKCDMKKTKGPWIWMCLMECNGDNLDFLFLSQAAMNVDHEVNLLVEEIHRLGSKNADGKLSVKFGVLFRDDKCANLFEALVGTLKAAKRRKIVTYSGELLLQGVHDDVDIVLLQD